MYIYRLSGLNCCKLAVWPAFSGMDIVLRLCFMRIVSIIIIIVIVIVIISIILLLLVVVVVSLWTSLRPFFEIRFSEGLLRTPDFLMIALDPLDLIWPADRKK